MSLDSNILKRCRNVMLIHMVEDRFLSLKEVYKDIKLLGAFDLLFVHRTHIVFQPEPSEMLIEVPFGTVLNDFSYFVHFLFPFLFVRGHVVPDSVDHLGNW